MTKPAHKPLTDVQAEAIHAVLSRYANDALDTVSDALIQSLAASVDAATPDDIRVLAVGRPSIPDSLMVMHELTLTLMTTARIQAAAALAANEQGIPLSMALEAIDCAHQEAQHLTASTYESGRPDNVLDLSTLDPNRPEDLQHILERLGLSVPIHKGAADQLAAIVSAMSTGDRDHDKS